MDNENLTVVRAAKQSYNAALKAARKHLDRAAALRAAIVEEEPQFRGRSLTNLAEAQAHLALVRPFNSKAE